MSNLAKAIRLRLDDWVENALDPQAAAAACLAILDEHEHVPANGGEYTEYDFGCTTCHLDSHRGTVNGHGWCVTTRLIAEKLGVEI